MTRARDTADLLTLAPTSQALEPDTAMPLIHNGAMMVCQRSTSAPSLSSSQHYVIDRMLFVVNEGTFTYSQHADGPTGSGFKRCLKIDCTTADASLTADGQVQIAHRFEGQNLKAMRKGFSDAKKVTWAFWVKTNKTGNYVAEIKDHDNTRTVGQVFSVDSADTWEKKVLVFPADTSTGDKFTDDQGLSMDCKIWLAAGTDYTSGTLATAWADQTNANRAVGQNVNIADNTDNEFLTTGWQLEIGEYTATTIPPFRHLPFALDLLRCQRYYIQKADGNSQFFEMGGMYSGSLANGFTIGPCRMRNAPTVYVADGTDYFSFRSDNGDRTSNSINGAGSQHGARIQNLYVSGLTVTQGYGGFFRTNNASAYVHFSSDL